MQAARDVRVYATKPWDNAHLHVQKKEVDGGFKFLLVQESRRLAVIVYAETDRRAATKEQHV